MEEGGVSQPVLRLQTASEVSAQTCGVGPCVNDGVFTCLMEFECLQSGFGLTPCHRLTTTLDKDGPSDILISKTSNRVWGQREGVQLLKIKY